MQSGQARPLVSIVAQAVVMPELPQLPLPKGQNRRDVVPGGVNPRGPLKAETVEYPDNSRISRSALMPPRLLVQRMGLESTSLVQPLTV